MPGLVEAGDIILASASESRAAMLRAAGVPFAQVPPGVDEDALKAGLSANGFSDPTALAASLAQAKALSVSRLHPRATVIGADQVLASGRTILSKPATRAEARSQLLALRGGRHALHSAVCVARDGEIVWRADDTAWIGFRAFSDAFLERYLDAAGEDILHCVGACRIEDLGIHLLSSIDGDFFTILGMPLLPLLDGLRAHNLVPS